MLSKIARFPWTSPRVIAGASGACLLGGALACQRAEAPAVAAAPPVVLAAPEAVVAAPPPAHGGTVVVAGEYPVEVVPHASGEVYAYVVGPTPPPPTETELAVVVPVTGGVRTVELEWDPGHARWGGRVRRVEIVPGPIDVVLVVGGTRWLAHAPTIVILPAIVVATAPAVVVVEGDRGKHRKHRKHRGHGGHDVRIRFGH